MDLSTAQRLIGDALTRSSLSVTIFDSELRIAWANEAAGTSWPGLPAREWPGWRLAQVMPEIDADAVEQSLRRVLATGEDVVDLQVSNRPGVWAPESYWSCLQFRVGAPEGDDVMVVHVMRDVTERAQSQRRLALTDRASAQIGQRLDTRQTADELLDVIVPDLADVAAVDLLDTVIEGKDPSQRKRDESLRLQRVALRWAPGFPVAADYASSSYMQTNPQSLHHQRFVAGLPLFLPAFGAMSREQVSALDIGLGQDRLLIAHGAGAHSLMVVPLTARGVIIGLVVMYRLRGTRPFTEADLSLAGHLVSHASLLIDNARLYARERASALVLQRALLPRDIPEVPDLDLCYRYVPAETTAEVGGDWFDVIALDPGRYAFVVGDVTGHDIRAASVMGQLRTATRALASLDPDPAELLGRLDHVAADLTNSETFATCIYAVHDTATGDWEMVSAGHPPPVLVSPGHRADFLDLPAGLPLGVGGGQYQATRIKAPPHSTLVLYTDGLVERPDSGIATGMASLAATLTEASELKVGDVCQTLLTSLAPRPADDIAVLLARTLRPGRRPAGSMGTMGICLQATISWPCAISALAPCTGTGR